MTDSELLETVNQGMIEICLRGLRAMPLPKERKMNKRQTLKQQQREWARERLAAMDQAIERDK